MTILLQQAFAEAAKLSPAEQDGLATRLLAELSPENEFDRAITASSDKLVGLAGEAVNELRAGRTQELDLNQL